MSDNVISIAEWKAKQKAKHLRKEWVYYPIPDPTQPLGYRLELVEATPLEPRVHHF
jgi:hypothetical protein